MTTDLIDAGRLSLALNDLRLPAIDQEQLRRVCESLAPTVVARRP